jgi:quinol monooxygenase YgiN
MTIGRREFLAGAAALAVVGRSARAAAARTAPAPHHAHESAQSMYGLIGKMTAVAGQRDALVAILLEGVAGMPGCLSYVVAHDPADADAIWITEVWDSEASHAASLTLPSVREAIARGRPLIAGFGEHTVTAPIGGHGLGAAGAR